MRPKRGSLASGFSNLGSGGRGFDPHRPYQSNRLKENPLTLVRFSVYLWCTLHRIRIGLGTVLIASSPRLSPPTSLQTSQPTRSACDQQPSRTHSSQECSVPPPSRNRANTEARSGLTARGETELPLSPWFHVLAGSRTQTYRSVGAPALAY